MQRLIDANALIADYRVCGPDCKGYEDCSGYIVMCDMARFRQAINEQPTVDASPVQHGQWKDCSNGWMCSECNRDSPRDYSFCPHCGAKMNK